MDRGLTQRTLAVRLGCWSETIAAWERGESEPLARRWPDLAEQFARIRHARANWESFDVPLFKDRRGLEGDLGDLVNPAGPHEQWQDHGLGLLRTILHQKGVLTDMFSTRQCTSWDEVRKKMQGYDIAGIGIPLLALFFREPLTHLIEGKRPLLKEGLFTLCDEMGEGTGAEEAMRKVSEGKGQSAQIARVLRQQWENWDRQQQQFVRNISFQGAQFMQQHFTSFRQNMKRSIEFMCKREFDQLHAKDKGKKEKEDAAGQ
jgi:transcriptional regulator with XRE-family HTH domain